MAKLKDSEIEQCLRRVVQEAKKKDEDITVKRARERAETQLGLEAGFFRSAEWKQRSKDIIEATFEGDDEEEVENPASPAPQPPKITSKQPDTAPRSQQRSKKVTVATKETVGPPTEAEAVPAGEKKTTDKDARKTGSESKKSSRTEASEAGKQQTESTNQDSPTRPDKVAPRSNGVKRKADVSSGSASGSGEDENESESASDEEHEEPRKKKARTESASTSAESSEDDGSEVDGVAKPATKQKSPVTITATSTAPSPAKATKTAIPPKPYKPPSGYTALECSTQRQGNTFSDASLEGKQIWHISAPSNVPLSSITSVALDAIRNSSTVLIHKGADYVLQENESRAQGSQTVFVPKSEGHECIRHPVTRSLQLQQKITLPDLSLTARQASQVTGSQAAANVAQPSVSRVRAQPKGLRMRYRPPGFGTGKVGRLGSGSDSTGEDEDEQTKDGRPDFQFPKALGAHENSGRRKGDAGDVADVEKLPEKAKKKRKGKGAAEGRDEVMVNGVGDHDPAPADEDMANSDLPNGTAAGDASKEETKEERKKRKQEKRARKEAKRRARA